MPKNADEEMSAFLNPYLNYWSFSPKLKRFKNVFLTNSGIAVNNLGLIKESCHDYPEQHKIFSNEAFFSYQQAKENPENVIELIDERIYISIHHPWFNYFHWISEAIFRLWLAKDVKGTVVLLLPASYERLNFVMESIEPFKIDFFVIPNRKSVFIKNLCLPQIKPICDSYNEKQVHEIRHFYLEHIKLRKLHINLGERIYVSRSKFAKRTIINESEVLATIEKFGFKIIFNEDYTFFEQVAIYSNAKYLVSIHGAGLTNMLFMAENSKILEINKKKANTTDPPSFVFWYLADALKFDYLLQLCQPLHLDEDYYYASYYINIELLEKNLKLLFSNEVI